MILRNLLNNIFFYYKGSTVNDHDRLAASRLSRRDILTLIGAAGATFLGGHAARSSAAAPPSASRPSCVVTPAQTEGPFFVDARLNRSDIRSDPADGSIRAGVPLALNFVVWSVTASGCTPRPDAIVDIWHCDALGAYSGTGSAATKFLRGHQVTDASGRVAFSTIYPGGYEGRATHIHFKVRGRNPSGGGYEFTSQLYFDDAVTDRVHARQPYAATGRRAMRNDRDYSYRNGGNRLLLTPVESSGAYSAGYDIGLTG